MKALLSALTLALMLPATNALAKSASVTIDVKVKSAEAVYHSANQGLGEYENVQTTTVQDQIYKGTGILRSASSESKRNVKEVQRPGVDYRGKNNLVLIRQTETDVLVKSDVDMVITAEGATVELKMDHAVPAKITKGSWASYQAGEEIEVEYTKEGRQMDAEAAAGAIEQAMHDLADELRYQLPVDDATVKVLKVKAGKSKITATKNRLVLTGSGQQIKVKMTIKGSW